MLLRRVWSETFSSQAAAAAATGRAVSHARQEPPGRDRCGFPSRRLKPPGALQGAALFSAANPLEPFRSFRGRLGGCRFPQFCVTSCAVPPLPGEGSRAGVWAAAGPRVALLSCQGARPETGLAWAGAYGLCSSPSGGLGGAQCLREGSEGGGRARLGRMREGSERPGCRWGGEGEPRAGSEQSGGGGGGGRDEAPVSRQYGGSSRARPAAAAAQTPTQRGGAGLATQTASAAASVTLLSSLRVSQSLPQHPPHPLVCRKRRRAAVYASPRLAWAAGAPAWGSRLCCGGGCAGRGRGLPAGWEGGRGTVTAAERDQAALTEAGGRAAAVSFRLGSVWAPL